MQFWGESIFCGQTYMSVCKITYLQKLRDDSNLTVQPSPPPTGSDTGTAWEKLSTLQMPQLPATCPDHLGRLLITSSSGDSWALAMAKKVQTKMSLCKQKQAHATGKLVGLSLGKLQIGKQPAKNHHQHIWWNFCEKNNLTACTKAPKKHQVSYFQLQLRAVWQTTNLFSITSNQPQIRF